MAQPEQPTDGQKEPRGRRGPPEEHQTQQQRDHVREQTIADHGRTDVVGPSARASHDPTDVTAPDAIHDSSRGATFRAGAAKPEHVKWYAGQGGITGTRSGTPFATSDPHTPRAPDDPPPKGWDPKSTAAVDVEVAGGEARRERAPRGSRRKR